MSVNCTVCVPVTFVTPQAFLEFHADLLVFRKDWAVLGGRKNSLLHSGGHPCSAAGRVSSSCG